MSVIESLSFKLGGEIPADLFTTTAESIVNELKADALRYDKYGNLRDNHIKTSQIRRFYNDLIAIKSQIELASHSERNERLKLQIPYINMLITKTRYAQSRDLAGKKFVSFVEKGIIPLDPAKPEESYKHFLLFCSLFEAVIAYSSSILGNK